MGDMPRIILVTADFLSMKNEAKNRSPFLYDNIVIYTMCSSNVQLYAIKPALVFANFHTL